MTIQARRLSYILLSLNNSRSLTMTSSNQQPTHRYRYSHFESSLAPVIQISLKSRSDSASLQCSALLDTGSPKTFVPASMLEDIGSKPFGRVKHMGGAANGKMLTAKHKVLLRICDLDFQKYEIWSWSNDKSFILLGRDILNLCLSSFYGPQKTFELAIGSPRD